MLIYSMLSECHGFGMFKLFLLQSLRKLYSPLNIMNLMTSLNSLKNSHICCIIFRDIFQNKIKELIWLP